MFVTVPKSPREVMSVVPVNEFPLTVPWNVTSMDPPSGNWLWPENVTASFETMPEVIGTCTRPACGCVNTRLPVSALPFWFSVSSAVPCHVPFPPGALA